MTSPRELLDDYGSSYTGCDGECTHNCNDDRGDLAPKAFAALRAVLAECDFLDACIADYKGHEIAGLIRNSITRALEETP